MEADISPRTPLATPGWWPQCRQAIQQHPLTAASLAIALTGVLLLLLQSVILLWSGQGGEGARYGIIGGLAGFTTTALGALPALFLRNLPQRLEDAMLGFAAGMMLAASAFSLILPGLEAATTLTGHAGLGAGIVVIGMTLGVLLMLGLDQFTPHEHDKTGPVVRVMTTVRGSGCSYSPSPCITSRKGWPSGSALRTLTCQSGCR